ncbi:MAG TPA: hypothetical protein VN029_05815, partial [Sphingomonas sp.]|nr:hypothetical protein [Sphingomonas sp.]
MGVLKLSGGAVAAIAMIGLALPAEAQRWQPERKRHHEDKFDVGDAIVGGLVVSGLLALVSSGKKKPRPIEAVEDVPPPEDRVPIDTGPVADSRYG